MSGRGCGYVGLILVAGLVLCTQALVAWPTWPLALAQWPTFTVLVVLATLAQLHKAEAPNHVLFYATPVFFFAGLLLLAPPLFVLLVVVPHLIEWARERWRHSAHLRAWYLQPFNVAMFVLAGSAGRLVYAALDGARVGPLSLPPIVVVTAAALTYLVVNHAILGQALVLARGTSWRDAGLLDAQTNQMALILLLMGYVVAVLWQLSPWVILPALAPLLLIYRALAIPQLQHEAHVDGKTGVFNARHFDTLYAEEFARAERFNRPLAFIMADLDFLRDINNTYGHLAGDAVLARIGALLRQTVRDYDSVGRFGGEEFAIVLPETGVLEAQMTAERLRAAIAAARIAVATSPEPIGVTMSLGVACYPCDAATRLDLTHAADAAVYQAKAGGRNRVVCAADVPRSRSIAESRSQPSGRADAGANAGAVGAARRHGAAVVAEEDTGECAAVAAGECAAVAAAVCADDDQTVPGDVIAMRDTVAVAAQARALRRLLADGLMQVAFQPIWDLERGRILAYEALARPAARYGFTGPQEAFTVADQFGQAPALDALCRQAILARAAALPSGVLLFVNVSPATLAGERLTGTTLVEAVTAVGLTPSQVVLEMTERAIARPGVVAREVARLRRLGFGVALDDAGAGQAGLEMLSQIPMDFIKVDRTVVAQAHSAVAARAVLAGILAMARERGTYVIAEGIETAEMLAFVRQVGRPQSGHPRGIQGAQGYLLGRPADTMMPEADGTVDADGIGVGVPLLGPVA